MNRDNHHPSPMQQFRNSMQSMRSEIAKQLPKEIDPDRFIRTAITVVGMRPDLLEADRQSLFGAFMLSAKDGLLPDDREATIQIYNTNVGNRQNPQWVKKAQYMPMVGGLLAKMYESGAKYIDAAAVYEKDHFRFARGDEPRIEHEPYLGAEDPGNVIAAYAIAKLSNGEIKREVMPRRDIEKIREASKSSNGPGWTNWYDQFAIKGVLKRLYKQMPHQNDTLQSVIEHDNNAMQFQFDQKGALGYEQQEPEPPALQHLTDDEFQQQLNAWAGAIDSGRMDAEQVISMAETRWQLTDEQRHAIRQAGNTDEPEAIDGEWLRENEGEPA
ncbi:recombinase RecT [Thioalkalivibrio sp. ARh3]|uniref:recombinase RecT n=1 Tax=Thioalkalivibrio sp. ARh3 TaxID=1158148 RepID=UPI0003A24CDF|nr:recombinase RecT [Thioalkalivibrio sp. ARh3]